MSHQPSLSRMSRCTGFSLIEVLVALVILSVGVVGVAGVQLSAIKFNQVSQQRSVASQHALSIAERMRANLAAIAVVAPAVSPYVFNFPFSGIPAEAAKLAAPAKCDSVCSPLQLANRNLKDWLDALSAGLPDGRGIITRNGPAAGAPYVVTVMWREKELTGGGGFLRAGNSCPADAPTDVQCVRLEFQP